MADTEYSPHLVTNRARTRPHATWGTFVTALVLALLLGLSAADINRPGIPADTTLSSASDGRALDGRGKWAGYL